MAKLYKVTNEIEDVRPKSDDKFTLAELQTLVGGFFEPLPGFLAIMNDDADMPGNELPYNELASRRFGRVLRGDVVEFHPYEWETIKNG